MVQTGLPKPLKARCTLQGSHREASLLQQPVSYVYPSLARAEAASIAHRTKTVQTSSVIVLINVSFV
jgi:hypothetical protein